jgi:CheY-like chemotaxis protein
VITDLHMPSMSGHDFAEKLWNIRPGISVVVVTGDSADLSRDALIDQRFGDVLLKPFNLRSLGGAVYRVLNAGRRN